MKDFAKSFDQIRWAHAVASYERMIKFTKSEYAPLRQSSQHEIDRLVKQFPQLSKHGE